MIFLIIGGLGVCGVVVYLVWDLIRQMEEY